jgi:hypothetical protein
MRANVEIIERMPSDRHRKSDGCEIFGVSKQNKSRAFAFGIDAD